MGHKLYNEAFEVLEERLGREPTEAEIDDLIFELCCHRAGDYLDGLRDRRDAEIDYSECWRDEK